MRIPELGQSHRTGDKGTTREIFGRQVQWDLITEWWKWGIRRNEEEAQDTPKPLLPARVAGGQRAHRRELGTVPHTAGAW